MSDAFVDVSWRGLEVGKRIKLHAIHAADAYLDHGTPMPVGTQLVIKTDEGLEIGVSVVRVHEQVGGSAEVPGMQVVPRALEGSARAWWEQRAEAAPVEMVAEPEVEQRQEITSRPTLTMSQVEMDRALAAGGKKVIEPEPEPGASSTEVMAAINPETLDGVPELPADVSDDGLVDDGRRTMAMSAMDISAIVEAAETETSGAIDSGPIGNGDDDGPSGDGPSSDGPAGSTAGATSKKRRGGGRGKNKRR